MKTLYISDLDGTLLRSDLTISAFSIKTINKLIENGICFAYATARSIYSASIVTKGLELRSPVITYNGTFIIDIKTGEKIVKNIFSSNEIKEISGFLIKNDIFPLVYSFIEGIERKSWLKGRETEGLTHDINTRKDDKRLREVLDIQSLYGGEVFYFTCIGKRSELLPVYDHLSSLNKYQILLQQDLYRNEYWCEIMPKNATKACAALKLKEITGCDRIICFGDALNDLPMFEISDECYAPSNALPELKKIATGIIGSNDEDGVAGWLKKNFEI